MSDLPLFSGNAEASRKAAEPLASRMRPRNLDEFIGQDHIVGPGRLLRRAIQKDALSSIILSGPPGSGKTTLARVIAGSTSRRFVTLNAVLDGVQAVRDAVQDAKSNLELYDRKTILFVDEVHRWNKSQQDALLPWVENGTIVFVGATTENPFFEVNRALVSRSRVFLLSALASGDLFAVARQALADSERGYGAWKVSFEDGALEHLVDTAAGDARNLLNALELAIETEAASWPPPAGAEIRVSKAAAEESIQRRAVLYDKDGDYHYDCASAFIKSLRGSDPDAALYWLARMIHAGEDPAFMFRRMLISACEDVGLADPNALVVVESCADAFERIGLPEGQYHLAQAALYLATAPKSNSSLGYFDALSSVEAERAEVPNALKDASRDGKGFGHGQGYKYPHAYRDHWVAQAYLPDALRGRVFYKPGPLGYEASIRELVLERREAQLLAADEESGPVESSYSESADRSREWLGRAEGSAASSLLALRKRLFERAAPRRNDRVLVLGRQATFVACGALRGAPDGSVVVVARSEREAGLVERYASILPDIERPITVVAPDREPAKLADEIARSAGFGDFDLVVGVDVLDGVPREPGAPAATGADAFVAAFHRARIVFGERLPEEGSRLSRALGARFSDTALASAFVEFEDVFYSSIAERRPFGSNDASRSIERETTEASRMFDESELRAWFSTASAYGRALAEALPERAGAIERACVEAARKPVEWKSVVAWIIRVPLA